MTHRWNVYLCIVYHSDRVEQDFIPFDPEQNLTNGRNKSISFNSNNSCKPGDHSLSPVNIYFCHMYCILAFNPKSKNMHVKALSH